MPSSADAPQDTDSSKSAESPKKSGLTRRSVVAGAAWTAPIVLAAASAPLAVASPSQLGCQPVGTLFNSQSNGRLLSGTLLSTQVVDLVLANITGAPTQLSGSQAASQTVSPLDGVIDLVGGALQFVTGPQSLGLLNQFSYANEFGTVDGSSGAVANDGQISLSPGQGEFALGTFDLVKVFTAIGQTTGAPIITQLLSQVTDLDLEVGAVAGRTAVNTLCNPPRALQGTPPAPVSTTGSVFSVVKNGIAAAAAEPAIKPPPPNGLQRDYILASLKQKIASPLIATLASALRTTIPATLPVTSQSILAVLQSIPLLGGLVGALGGASNLNVSVTVDTAGLLTGPIPGGANEPLTIDLGAGTILLDLAPLLGRPDSTFNGLPANTRLIADLPLPTGGVTALLNSFIDDLITRLSSSIQISIQADVRVLGASAARVDIRGSLFQFLNGQSTAAFVSVAGIEVPLGPVLNRLLGDLANTVIAALNTLLRPAGVLNSIFTPLNGLLSLVFRGLSEVLVVTINAQNDGSAKDPFPTAQNRGVYETASLYVGAIGALDVLNLYVARGTGGPNPVRSIPGVPAPAVAGTGKRVNRAE